MAVINNSRQVAAINRFGNRAPEVCGSKPVLLVGRDGRTGYLVEPKLFRVCGSTCIANERIVSEQFFKNRGRHSVDQVYFTALETQRFDFGILFDVEPYGVEIRK